MEKELFLASTKDQTVKVLGMRVDCKPQDLHIFINGKDIAETIVLEEVKITMEKKGV